MIKYIIVTLSTCLLTACQSNQPGSHSQLEQASYQLISRLSAKPSIPIRTNIITKYDKHDVYEVEITDGELILKGSSPAAIASAFNAYLRESGQGHLSWGGNHLNINTPPNFFPPLRATSSVELFYYFNYCTHGYTTPYWSWQDWEREIDLMAFNGVTHPLIISGIEEVFIRTFSQFGYSRQEIRDWLVLPAHLPWQLMGNLHSDSPILSENLVKERAKLGRRIADRLRSLGMQAVIPGYYGLVPDDFALRQQRTKDGPPAVIQQGDWVGDYSRPSMLNPNDPIFADVAAAYYKAVEAVFGSVNYYSADPFHEGGNAHDIDVPNAAKAIQTAMLNANSNATWVLQAWQSNPTPEILNALDKHHALVIDLWGDEDPAWDRDGTQQIAFNGVPWAWSIVQNFGGNTGLSGNLDTMLAQFSAEGVFNNSHQTGLIGLGNAMEGIHQNPVIQDFLFEMRWHNSKRKKIDLDNWLQEYATRRYGADNLHTRQAWSLLGETVYRAGQHRRQGTVESIFTARPALQATKASTWGPDYGPYYEEHKLEQAWKLLLLAGEHFKTVPTYQYDIVDIGRQVLANRGRHALADLSNAYNHRDKVAFELAKNSFLSLMLDQDRLLNTHKAFRLQTWLTQAKRWGQTPKEKRELTRNARRILTSWSQGDTDLRDYAHREWAGLLANYYYPRWQRYLDYLSHTLNDSEAVEPDLWHFESNWIQQGDKHASQQNDTDSHLEVARSICHKYCGHH